MKFFSVCLSVIVFVVFAFLLYRMGEYSFDFGYRVFTEKAMTTEENAKDKVVRITSDMGAKEIGDLLESKELIRDSNLFVVQLMLSAYKDDMKPGTYTLSTSMTAKEMMQVISAEEEEETETEDEK
ncbi:MAG: endolytic transglycosylase MltG [Lachnospiraceae bacterium]|uniref:endolytic transglycosylase MltG n=1 Tax=Roseburia sp. 1XD42-69 TaxID=2320088 RepID=UPI0013147731|nr:endolytic transglycosylase MltG [Roseburia sp. 1XD42-69]MCI8875643.1 endolytic transglycosylase MltG [Lachnospiraceae bacterium]MCX4318660.1 endolytic transglycosylase MltG [Lachnospiraceae bacterium]